LRYFYKDLEDGGDAMENDSDKALFWIGMSASIAVVGAVSAIMSGCSGGKDGDRHDDASMRGGEHRGMHHSKKMRLQTVDKVDLSRYLGSWYEIARIPNSFEDECASDSMAHYALLKDGRIEVVNTCHTADGKKKSVRGVAKVVDPVSKAKLKVRFGWVGTGDYWVLVLNSFYEYAVVGEPSRRYLWILSRTPSMDRGTYRGLLERIEELGYDSSLVVPTRQTPRTPQEQTANRKERDAVAAGSIEVNSASLR
jgi:apolipoprotein D and lipocalin family protein